MDRQLSTVSINSVREVILFKIDLLKKLFFGLNRYNGLERIAAGSTEMKRYNDS
jgi:hypothetical protein